MRAFHPERYRDHGPWQQRPPYPQDVGSFRTADIRRIVRREVEAAGLRAVPDEADDGYGHYSFSVNRG